MKSYINFKNMGIRTLVLVATLLSFCFLMLGCVAAGINRTSFKEWHEREFRDIGISLELPKDTLLVETQGVERWKANRTPCCTLRFFFHAWGSGHPMTEPLYLVQFRFERLSAKQYSEFRKGIHPLAYYWVWKDHSSRDYVNQVCFKWKNQKREVYGWRKDFHAKNGDVVIAGVEYIPVDFGDEIIAVDSNAIERVLNSVRVSSLVRLNVGQTLE